MCSCSNRAWWVPVIVALVLLSARTAGADGLNGFLRLGYSTIDTEITDENGDKTESKVESVLQRYHFSFLKTLYPYLKLSAGGLYQVQDSGVENDEDSDAKVTKWNPFIDLRLTNRIFAGSLGYDRRQEERERDRIEIVHDIMETYSSMFTWRPVGFPTVSAQYLKTRAFKEDRSRDRTEDFLNVGSVYSPVKGMDLRYRFSWRDNEVTTRTETDNVSRLMSDEKNHNASVSYRGEFFNGRLIPSLRYTITRRETATDGEGEFPFPEEALSGLSAVDETTEEVTLGPTAALTDNDLTASAGLGIGQGLSNQGDRTPRQMGLEFSGERNVNTLHVSIDRDLEDDVAGSFSWEVYISSFNDTWTRIQTVSSAPLEVAAGSAYRFVVRFQTVNTRLIKVVTKPLATTVHLDPGEPGDIINVTELDAFLTEFVPEGGTEETRTSQVGNLNARYRILDIPYVTYDFSYWFSDTGGGIRDILSNGLTARHTFNPKLAVSGRVAVENGRESGEDRFAFIQHASLRYTPLPALRHTLSYSGREQENDDETTSDYSITMKNFARLYEGVDLTVSGGLSFAERDTGRQQSQFLNTGLRVIPHRTATVQLNYTFRDSDSGSSTQTASAITTYAPLRSLYLRARIDLTSQEDAPDRTTEDYGINWSPFPDGNIHFSFTYSEEYTSVEDRTDRVMGPSLRWKILRHTFLDLSYRIVDVESPARTEERKSASAELRINF